MPVSYFINKSGLINASGADLTDFINRMSTNDLRKFPSGEYKYTFLTSDKGRIIDLINFVNFSDDKYFICTAGYEDKIITHLNKYIIMDDVSLSKAEGEFSLITIFTDEPAALSKDLFNIEIDDIKKNKIYRINEKDILFQDDVKFQALKILCTDEHVDVYRKLLKDSKYLSKEEYEYKRISEKLPSGVNELNEDINPMECGPEKFISFTKGCYIGQEVIARIESQGKIPKQLVIITSETGFEKGDKIFNGEKEAGFVSSAVYYDEKYSGLAFIRSTELSESGNYFIKKSDGNSEIKIKFKEKEIIN
ncbi:MAG: hypothetical protein IPM96_17270 [Ignavibacteria bacterium]|nr:hypothetical protein [Ignavibacteria bacterium]